MKEYLTDVGEVMKNENSSLAGLTTAEAAKRAEKYGKNKLKAAKKVPLIVRFLSQLGDPMTIILICAAVVSGILAVVEGESFAKSDRSHVVL